MIQSNIRNSISGILDGIDTFMIFFKLKINKYA